MSRETLINEIGEWLIDQTLSQPDIVELFQEVCERLSAVGVPVTRSRLTWPTLHPLFQAETILWRHGHEIEFEQFRHQDEMSEQWKASPMAYVLDKNLDTFRRNLDGPNKMLDFPILKDLQQEGYTDYLMIATPFEKTTVRHNNMSSGLLVMWSSSRKGGFSDDDLEALKKIQRRFAAACKNVVQNRIARNITETYLGQQAGREVLDGAIKLGDGRETEAVVWYSDMRNSTALADTMAPSDFLELLNDYFEATAGAAIEFGGEVLDFIGDAVLAIFPFEKDAGKQQAIRCGTMAIDRAIENQEAINARRLEEGKQIFQFGIGVNVGTLNFGNIGVASRLAFSVIGPTVNEVERIEELTKVLDSKALVSAEVAKFEPERWVSVGNHKLAGVAQSPELFCRAAATKTQPKMDAKVHNSQKAH
jgi:adenylate cyclase